MLRTTTPPEGMGVEENCFVRRIEAHQCVFGFTPDSLHQTMPSGVTAMP
jgi:hypothetical protein